MKKEKMEAFRFNIYKSVGGIKGLVNQAFFLDKDSGLDYVNLFNNRDFEKCIPLVMPDFYQVMDNNFTKVIVDDSSYKFLLENKGCELEHITQVVNKSFDLIRTYLDHTTIGMKVYCPENGNGVHVSIDYNIPLFRNVVLFDSGNIVKYNDSGRINKDIKPTIYKGNYILNEW